MAQHIDFQEDSPKAEILQAALEEFVEFGKKGARMQSIADRADVNKALLHYYFTSKDNLHQEVLRRIFQKAMENISGPLETSAAPDRQIRLLIRRYFTFIRNFPELPRLMVHEISSQPREVAHFFAQLFTEDRHFPRAIMDILRDGMDQGQFRQDDPRQTLITILSTILFFFIAKPLLTNVLEIENEDTFFNQRLAHVENFVMYALERRAS